MSLEWPFSHSYFDAGRARLSCGLDSPHDQPFTVISALAGAFMLSGIRTPGRGDLFYEINYIFAKKKKILKKKKVS